MKKTILTILLCSLAMLGITGCIKDEVSEISLEDANIKIQEYFENEKNDHSNLVYNYIDSDEKKIIVGLIDNSEEKQEEFLNSIFKKETIKYIKSKSLIEFRKKSPVTTSNVDFKIKRYNMSNDIKYNVYYENQERSIYFAGDIEEFYILDEYNNQTPLKDYITETYQTFDDSIKSITDKLDKYAMLKDGGTTIYKSKQLDLTMTVCNTINGNKDIYIDGYYKEFEETMCK